MTEWVATIIASEDCDTLTSHAVSHLSAFFGAEKISWLSPSRAVDFYFSTPRDNHEAVHSHVQSEIGLADLVIQPVAGRRKQLLIADMDSTMIEQECIDELAAEAGIGAEVVEITARAMNGELDFEAALIERVRLLKDLPVHTVDKVLNERVSFTPGGSQLVATMKANGAHSALVSGGFTLFTQQVAQKLGFDENYANQLAVVDGCLTGEVVPPILGRAAKAAQLNRLCGSLGIDKSQVIAVGDGANDLDMLGAAGTGVALHAKPVVAVAASHRIDHGNLLALLYIQGYSDDEIIGT